MGNDKLFGASKLQTTPYFLHMSDKSSVFIRIHIHMAADGMFLQRSFWSA
jgi:hypothetical protein